MHGAISPAALLRLADGGFVLADFADDGVPGRASGCDEAADAAALASSLLAACGRASAAPDPAVTARVLVEHAAGRGGGPRAAAALRDALEAALDTGPESAARGST